jgi:purine-binding chemotaxis protein CheW
VVNLRGVIVPIIDLRLKLHLAKADYNEFTVVIILNIKGTMVGVVVDSVSDVVTMPHSAIKAAPQFDAALDGRFITGLANVGERMLIVMNMEAMLSSAELGLLASVVN